MGIDLTSIQPMKVSTDPRGYSFLLFGESKIGKSTFVNELFGKKVLHIMTENRYGALANAMVVKVNNWADFKQVLRQIPKVKDQYDAISIDTVENLYAFCERYIAQVFGESIVGAGDVPYGKDYTLLKTYWKQGLQDLEALGLTTVFVSHAVQQTVQIPKESLLEADVSSLEGANEVVTKKGEHLMEFLQYQPDLPAKALGPVTKMVDNILFAENTIDSAGNQVRVLHLRGTLQWQAGTTFKNVRQTIPFSAEGYIKEVKNAFKSYDEQDTTTKTIHHADLQSKAPDFNDLKAKTETLVKKLVSDGKGQEAKVKMVDVLGTGQKISTLKPNQVELLQAVYQELQLL